MAEQLKRWHLLLPAPVAVRPSLTSVDVKHRLDGANVLPSSLLFAMAASMQTLPESAWMTGQ